MLHGVHAHFPAGPVFGADVGLSDAGSVAHHDHGEAGSASLSLKLLDRIARLRVDYLGDGFAVDKVAHESGSCSRGMTSN